GAQLRAFGVEGLDRPGPRRDALAQLGRRQVHRHPGLVAMQSRRDALGDVRGGISGRRLAGLEANPGRGRSCEAVDAEGAPVLALAVPSEEVPATSEVDQRVRLDLPPALRSL